MVSSGRITSQSLPGLHAHIGAITDRMAAVPALRSSTTVTRAHGTVRLPRPATTVGCMNDAEVVDGVLSMLDSHEFVFARLMGLTDTLGCAYPR
jgi:hypothetical protein